MSRRKKDIIIFSILVPVLAFLLVFPMRKRAGRNLDEMEFDDSTETASETPALDNKTTKRWEKIHNEQIELESSYLKHGFSRDPFANKFDEGPVEEVDSHDTGKILVLKLSGVFRIDDNTGENPENSRAIINGRILAKGQSIHGMRIKTIGPEEVILTKDGRCYLLKVGKPLKIKASGS